MVDDYDEERALEECAQEGAQPGSIVADRSRPIDGIVASSSTNAWESSAAGRRDLSVVTQFAGNGRNPWVATSGDGQGYKRAKLLEDGVNETNWMHKLAADAREADRQLRRDRESRMIRFEDPGVSTYPQLYPVVARALPPPPPPPPPAAIDPQEEQKPQVVAEQPAPSAQPPAATGLGQHGKRRGADAAPQPHRDEQRSDIVIEDRPATLAGRKRTFAQIDDKVNVVRGVYEVRSERERERARACGIFATDVRLLRSHIRISHTSLPTPNRCKHQ